MTFAQSGTASDSSKASKKKISAEKVGSPEIDNCSFEPLSPEPFKLTLRSLQELAEKPLSIELTWQGSGDTGPMPLKCYDTEFFAKKHLRRSPRLKPATKNGVGEDVKIVTETSDGKYVRSTRCSSSLARDESIEIDTFSKLSDALYRSPSMGLLPYLGKSDVKELNGKYLQSSREATSVFEAETVLEEGTLIKLLDSCEKQLPQKIQTDDCSKNKLKNGKTSFFIGDPIPDDEAQERWRWRYEMKVIG